MQTMCNVWMYILKFACFTAETISIIDWDIHVLPSLTPYELHAYNGRGSWLHCRVHPASTNENPKLFPDIMIGNHRLIREHILDGGRLRYHHVPARIPAWRSRAKMPGFTSVWWLLLWNVRSNSVKWHFSDLSGHSGETHLIIRSRCVHWIPALL
jgi:hypothetical protein